MSRIKTQLLSLYTKRATRICSVTRASVGFDRARRIGILYSGNSAEKQEVIRQLTAQLNQLGKQVTVLCYVPTSSLITSSTITTTTQRDIRLWGAITYPPTKIFVNTSFDYLYQVDLDGHPVVDYLLAQSRAKCRVGNYNTKRTALFEIMVRFRESPGSNEVAALASQMLLYTQCLKAT